MQTYIGIIGAPDAYNEKTKISTLNVARQIIHDPRMKNPQEFSNKVLRKLEKISEEN